MLNQRLPRPLLVFLVLLLLSACSSGPSQPRVISEAATTTATAPALTPSPLAVTPALELTISPTLVSSPTFVPAPSATQTSSVTPAIPAATSTRSPAPAPVAAIPTSTVPSTLVAATPTGSPAPTTAPATPTITAAPATPTQDTAPAIATNPLATLEPTLAPTLAPPAEAAPGAAGIGDHYYPQLGNGGYNALHYTLDLSVRPASNTLTGKVTMIARATADLSAFNLDFHGFALGDITVADTSATSRRSGHELTITPAQPLRQGETFTTTIAYSGVPTPVRSVALPVEVGWNKYADGSYVASEPEGAATWFPVNDHPRDKASYTFRISVPKPYVAAANGVLADTIDHGATRTYVWQMGRPMASYLATVNIGKFVMKTETGPDGLPIRNFFPPRIERQATKAFGRTSEMIRYFSTLFGPFPFETYGVVAPDVELGFALETQTLSIFGRDQVEQIAEDGNDQEVAHEITHQWYGDSVSLASWQDVWLNEGFATFGEWLWVEHTSGRGAYDAAVRDAYSGADPADVPPPGNPPPDNLFNSGVYGRGALTLAALRLRVGDDLFFRIMRAYAERFRYGNATTAGFIAVAQQVSGRDLKTFFDEWLYRRPLPAIPELGLRAG